MIYQDFCDSIKELKKKEVEYNEWRKSAIQILLTKVGPRLIKCGHTDIKRFGELLSHLALPITFTVEQCENVNDQCSEMVINKVLFEALLESVKNLDNSNLLA